jgi:hypothetical protein
MKGQRLRAECPVGRVARGAACSTILLSAPSLAITANPLPRVCNEFPRSDYVFTGKVLSDTYQWHDYFRGEPSEIFRIRVGHVFKGRVPPIVRLYTSVDSGRGVLTTGQQAIVFATRIERRIAFDGSSNSRSGPGVSDLIRETQNYLSHPPQAASIAGRVDNSGAPLGRVLLVVTNGRSRQFMRTDARGKFLVALPPGRWSIRIAEHGWASRTGAYSYDRAEDVKLAKGGCADLQIETAKPNEKLEGPDWRRWPR